MIELTLAMGFKNWSITTKPCWLCGCTGANMFHCPASALDAWNDVTPAPFAADVQACVAQATVDERQLQFLQQDLVCAARCGGLVCVKDYGVGGSSW